jgi:S-DNA-T family DNA segregation ATPase FtsK/SpoIIIE
MSKNGAHSQSGKTSSHRDIIGEIWGILFLACGLLVLIALVSHFIPRSENVLGPYVGTALAGGLIVIFGALPSFFFPGMVLLLGWRRVRGEELGARFLLYASLIALEICVLLAITNQAVRQFSPNLIGTIVVYFMQHIFGLHRFGPYFITALGLLITVLLAFRINFITMVRIVATAVRAVGAWAMRKSEQTAKDVKAAVKAEKPAAEPWRRQEPVDEAEEDAEEEEPPRQKKARKAEKKPFDDHESGEDENEQTDPGEPDPEEEARLQLQKQLAEFRAKKKQPIQIITEEKTPVEQEDAAQTENEHELAHLSQVQKQEEESPEEKPSEVQDAAEAAPAPDAEGSDVSSGQILPAAEGEIPPDQEPAPAGAEIPADYYKLPSEPVAPKKIYKPYEMPSSDILPDPPAFSTFIDEDAIKRNSAILEKTLLNFTLEGKVVNVCPGPVVTRYEIELAPGVKVSRVVSLQDDISMAVGGQKIRIQAPIPGKAAIGIELPNENRQIVYFKHVLLSEAFQKSKAKLPIVIGRTISGIPFVSDIAKMPHLLIAGQTGSGKSVCINAFICSLLMTRTPQELRLIMIDPKKVELSYYQGIPHLIAPVVTESKEAVKALAWGIGEMDRRYRMLAKVGARNMESFNERLLAGKIKEGILSDSDNKPLPYIVIIVDELADLMITASKDVEASIQRIAQLARAVGIHLIVATQRPSVDIITGPIKANLTSRVAFRTIQATDSRTILGHIGAEKLLGQGDMLFLRSGAPEIERFHGAYISEEDVEKVVQSAKQEADVRKMETFLTRDDDDDDSESGGEAGDRDELFEEAARLIVSVGQGSTSLLQRRMKIGYARAGRLMDELEMAGIVGPSEGSKMREVLVRPLELEQVLTTLMGN